MSNRNNFPCKGTTILGSNTTLKAMNSISILWQMCRNKSQKIVGVTKSRFKITIIFTNELQYAWIGRNYWKLKCKVSCEIVCNTIYGYKMIPAPPLILHDYLHIIQHKHPSLYHCKHPTAHPSAFHQQENHVQIEIPSCNF